MYRFIRTSINCVVFLCFLMVIIGCKDNTKGQVGDQAVSNIIDSPIKAPNFKLNTLEGNSVSLNDFKGKFVILHIATTWCPFCNAEVPYLEKIHQDYKDKNVAVLLIDVKESEELVKEKLKDKYNLTFPILLDEDGSVAASFAPKDVLLELDRDEVMLASNLLIDPDGNIQFMSLLDSKNFDAELNELKARLNELL